MNAHQCFIAGLLLAAPAFADSPGFGVDKTFVGKVSQGGSYEVAASKFALLHANTPDVKDQANTEVHDHTLVGDTLHRVSAAAGIPIVPALNPEFAARLDKLKSAVGPGFDAAYIADMRQIHDKDEKLFAQAATEGSDAFKLFAHQTDLIVKRHIGALAAN